MQGSGLTGTGSGRRRIAASAAADPTRWSVLAAMIVYYVSNTADVVVEAANGGFDTVVASVDYTLPASNTVEVLHMQGSGLTGTGSDGAEIASSAAADPTRWSVSAAMTSTMSATRPTW